MGVRRQARERRDGDAPGGALGEQNARGDPARFRPFLTRLRLEAGAKPPRPTARRIALARDDGDETRAPLDTERLSACRDREAECDGVRAAGHREADHGERKRMKVLVAMRSASRRSSDAGTATTTLPRRAFAKAPLFSVPGSTNGPPDSLRTSRTSSPLAMRSGPRSGEARGDCAGTATTSTHMPGAIAPPSATAGDTGSATAYQPSGGRMPQRKPAGASNDERSTSWPGSRRAWTTRPTASAASTIASGGIAPEETSMLDRSAGASAVSPSIARAATTMPTRRESYQYASAATTPDASASASRTRRGITRPRPVTARRSVSRPEPGKRHRRRPDHVAPAPRAAGPSRAQA